MYCCRRATYIFCLLKLQFSTTKIWILCFVNWIYIQSDHRHTYTRLTALFPGLPGWAGTRKVKPIWILLKQETVSGSGISWIICMSASRSRQITTPVPHYSSFLQAGCPSCRPTNSVRALKAHNLTTEFNYNQCDECNRAWSHKNWFNIRRFESNTRNKTSKILRTSTCLRAA